MKRILITGGAGFVGSALALQFRSNFPSSEIWVFDNLKRRGSELNLPRLQEAKIGFHHGDVRIAGDLATLPGNFDLIIEASAEPSVVASASSSVDYVLDTNFGGAKNCLEFLRARGGLMIFLSTSRVYSLAALRAIRLKESETRFEISSEQSLAGVSAHGINEEFSTATARSFYGTSKLAAEMLIQEYAELFQSKCIVNRCGVLAGPGQFGKSDQGVFTLWVASHLFGRPIKYTGYGGNGKQVRDLLHPTDLYSLLQKQIESSSALGAVYNVGGGATNAVSLLELNRMCEEVNGKAYQPAGESATHAMDVPLYISDCRQAESAFGWKPQISVKKIVTEIHSWLRENEQLLRKVIG